MPAIDTPLLIVGQGPAALVIAKTVSGRGLPSLVIGHEPIDAGCAVELGPEALAAMAPHGVLEVLRPYAATQDPFAIAPLLFEQGLKHHCIADMLVTIFDEMVYEASSAVAGVLTDGRRRWSVTADHMIDVSELPTELNSAIVAGAAAANSLVDSFTARRPRTSG